jgi:rare lipoprotein A
MATNHEIERGTRWRHRMALSLLVGLATIAEPLAQSPTRTARRTPTSYELFGQRYHILRSADGFSQRGIASWYGGSFHGNPTASGEIYDMHAMTAAHKTLPIPTDVEVTNLRNGKTVVVRVNDRGPFLDDRIIDLSFAAAEALDLVGPGTGMVQVRAIGTRP